VPENELLTFYLYPGRFEKELLRSGSLRLYASFSSLEYADFAVFKEAELVEGPLGLGPKKWYLAVSCDLVTFMYGHPSKVHCLPGRVLWKPAPPPRRSFFYILEALVLITRLHIKDERAKIVLLLKEAERLGDEEDKRVVKKLLEVVGMSRTR